mgnify:CR=1 FL=1
MTKRPVKLRRGAAAILVAVAAMLANPISPATAQMLEDDAALPWWPSAGEPRMVAVDGSLREPAKITLRLEDGAVLSGERALAFLFAHRYLETHEMNGTVRVKTTARYKDWRAAHPRTPVAAPAPSPASAAATPATSTPAAAPQPVHRLSGGLDPVQVAALVDKARRGGSTLTIEGDPIAFEFMAGSAGPGAGALRLATPSFGYHWVYRYGTGMVDRVDASCVLQEGRYTVLDTADPTKMIGGWGGKLVCRVVASRDGRPTSDTTEDHGMMINYDAARKGWTVIVLGLIDGQWLLH